MPTPFTHLNIAQKILTDTQLLDEHRTFLGAHRGAYYLGSVAADARIEAADSRAATHFYTYTVKTNEHPWRVMLAQFPTLSHPQDASQRAFLAGYVAHLATDERWTLDMLDVHFAHGKWGESLRWRFYVLHFLLTYMDERDEKALLSDSALTLRQSHPHAWLPFMPDATLCSWRDYLAYQLETQSETLAVMGSRIGHTPSEMRPKLDSSEWMNGSLWQHLSPATLAQIEGQMYDFSVEQLIQYLEETR